MNLAGKMLFALLLVPLVALAATEEIKLDRAPIDGQDLISLQRGVWAFVNYCLNCHSANYMRYNRLNELGLTEQQIRDNLVFTESKVGDLMKNAMDPKDSREWFGAPPPDLTVIARARASHAGSGADWLYTFLRSFYRDPSRPTGWNNTVFPNVGMPHVLYQLQGEQVLKTERVQGPGYPIEVQKLALEKPGAMAPIAPTQTASWPWQRCVVPCTRPCMNSSCTFSSKSRISTIFLHQPRLMSAVTFWVIAPPTRRMGDRRCNRALAITG